MPYRKEQKNNNGPNDIWRQLTRLKFFGCHIVAYMWDLNGLQEIWKKLMNFLQNTNPIKSQSMKNSTILLLQKKIAQYIWTLWRDTGVRILIRASLFVVVSDQK